MGRRKSDRTPSGSCATKDHICVVSRVFTISDDHSHETSASALQGGVSHADGYIPQEAPKHAPAERHRPSQKPVKTPAERMHAHEGTTRDNSADAISGRRKHWNRVFVCYGILIQLLLILAMWRDAHIEARRLFYTTYYDPFYPELYSQDTNLCFAGAHPSHSWTILDSLEAVRREGWSTLGMEIRHAVRHVGDQVWDRWGEQSKSRTQRPT